MQQHDNLGTLCAEFVRVHCNSSLSLSVFFHLEIYSVYNHNEYEVLCHCDSDGYINVRFPQKYIALWGKRYKKYRTFMLKKL